MRTTESGGGNERRLQNREGVSSPGGLFQPWEAEALAEPWLRATTERRGSAGASPSRDTFLNPLVIRANVFFTMGGFPTVRRRRCLRA